MKKAAFFTFYRTAKATKTVYTPTYYIPLERSFKGAIKWMLENLFLSPVGNYACMTHLYLKHLTLLCFSLKTQLFMQCTCVSAKITVVYKSRSKWYVQYFLWKFYPAPAKILCWSNCFICCMAILSILSTIGRWVSCGPWVSCSGVILELSEREKFYNSFRISGRSFGPNFGFPYTSYTFSLFPQHKIGRRQPA